MDKYQQFAQTVSSIFQLVGGITIIVTIFATVLGSIFHETVKIPMGTIIVNGLAIIFICIGSQILSNFFYSKEMYLMAIIARIPVILLIGYVVYRLIHLPVFAK